MNANLRPVWYSALAVLVLSAAGCAALFSEPQRPLFRLTAPSDFPASLPHVPVQVGVDLPDAPAGLDTTRIALSRSPVSLDYFADGDWTDHAPALVQTVLVEAFENCNRLAATDRQSFSLHADFTVESDLRHFEAVYDSQLGTADAPPAVWVALAVKLVKLPQHTIVAQTLISDRESAAANATPQIVLAFNAALASVVKQAVIWTVTNSALSTPRK